MIGLKNSKGVAFMMGLALLSVCFMAGCSKQETEPPASITAPATIEEPVNATDGQEQSEMPIVEDDEEEVEADDGGLTDELKAHAQQLGSDNSVLTESDTPIAEDEGAETYARIRELLVKAETNLKDLDVPHEGDDPEYRNALADSLSEATAAARVFHRLVYGDSTVTLDQDSIALLTNDKLDEGVYKLAFTMSENGETVAWFDGYYVVYSSEMSAVKLSDFKLADDFTFDNIPVDPAIVNG